MPLPPTDTTAPSISGTALQGQTLSEAHGSWTGSPTAFAYQWEDCDTSGNNCSPISGATGQTYALTASDVGHTVRVQETAGNAGGTGSPAVSPPTSVVAGVETLPGPGAASVRTASVSGTTVIVPVSCTGGGSCALTAALSVVETLRHGKITAVAAAAKTRRRTVALGSASVTIAAGTTRTIRVALNQTGKRLLTTHAPLAVRLKVSQSARTVAMSTVRITRPHKA